MAKCAIMEEMGVPYIKSLIMCLFLGQAFLKKEENMNEIHEATDYMFSKKSATALNSLLLILLINGVVSAVAVTIKIAMIGLNSFSIGFLIKAWALAICICLWAKIWHFDYAPRLCCTKNNSWCKNKLDVALVMAASIARVAVVAVDPVSDILRSAFCLFIVVMATCIFLYRALYAAYRLACPARQISFLDFCNTPRPAKR